jgi:hypothetical protein
MWRDLLANAALSTLFRTMPTIPTVLASVARVGTSAGGRKHIERYLIDQNN